MCVLREVKGDGGNLDGGGTKTLHSHIQIERWQSLSHNQHAGLRSEGGVNRGRSADPVTDTLLSSPNLIFSRRTKSNQDKRGEKLEG